MVVREFIISRKEFLENITGKPRKYCLDCQVFFDPTVLELDVHASHYCWFLPRNKEDFEAWVERLLRKEEEVWGAILDEDGVRSRPFCPYEFRLQVKD